MRIARLGTAVALSVIFLQKGDALRHRSDLSPRRDAAAAAKCEGPATPTTRTPGLVWLHIAKTGTSFLNTVYHYACPGIPQNASLEDRPPPEHPNYLSTEGILTERYHPDQFCGDGFARAADGYIYGVPQIRDGGTTVIRDGHQQLDAAMYAAHGENVVLMLREPVSRVMSLMREGGGVDVGDENWVSGMLGAQTTGIAQIEEGSGDSAYDRLGEAVRRLRSFRFVGLNEEWELSVRLFHRMLGGSCNPSVEFEHVRPSQSSNEEFERRRQRVLRFADPKKHPDLALYEEAKAIFWARVEEYGLLEPHCIASVCQS